MFCRDVIPTLLLLKHYLKYVFFIFQIQSEDSGSTGKGAMQSSGQQPLMDEFGNKISQVRK